MELTQQQHESADQSDDHLVIDMTGPTVPLGTSQARGKMENKCNRLCQVCGDKATGCHYKSYTCEGCKVCVYIFLRCIRLVFLNYMLIASRDFSVERSRKMLNTLVS